jgi:hypothetical protein
MAVRNRPIPELHFRNVPEKQHHALLLIGHNLDMLEYHLNSFEAALKLFEYSARQIRTQERRSRVLPFRRWQFMAARDGAMSIYHFAWAFQGLADSLRECDYVLTRLDPQVLKNCRRQISKGFPNFERVRHAVGHASEKARNPNKHLLHGFSGSYRKNGLDLRRVKNYVITDHLYRRTYANTWDGKIESYKLNSVSLKNLSAIRNIIFDALDDVASNL